MAKRKFVNENGEIKVKIIAPGQGSSAYYEEAQIERDHPVFRGRPVFWNHQTSQEERARPEGDLTDLVGKVKDTMYERDGPAGPGAYGIVGVVPYYQDVIDAVSPFAGLSIRAFGDRVQKKVGEATTFVAEKFTRGKSVDFVTEAGAGGQPIPLLESARANATAQIEAFREAIPPFIEGDGKTDAERFLEWTGASNTSSKEEDMELKEQLTQAQAENAALKESKAQLEKALVLKEAADIVGEIVLAEKDLADVTRARIRGQFKDVSPLKENKLDKDALTAAVKEAIKAEKAYIESFKPKGITGMGPAGTTDGKARLRESLIAMHLQNGEGKEKAERLADLAIAGR